MNLTGAFSPKGNETAFDATASLRSYGSGDAFGFDEPGIKMFSRNGKPFRDERTGCCCLYAGDIWNVKDIHKELTIAGHEDCSPLPEQVLCRAYAQWGTRAFKRLRGSFAVVLYDCRENKLLLARDRFGICTLFYGCRGSGFAFASRIRGMIAGGFTPRIGEEGLLEMLSMGPGRTPGNAVYSGINEVEPAQVVILGDNGISKEYYYRPSCQLQRVHPRQAAQNVYDLLFSSVQRNIENRKVCSMLSGGLDSSAISAIASKIQGGLLSFSIDYEGNSQAFKPSVFQPNSDADYTHMASQYIGSMHENVMLSREDLLRSLRPAMRARDLPGMGSVDGSLLLFCRQLSNWADAALSGECADEFFLGYPWFHRDELLNRPHFPFSDSVDLRKNVLAEPISGLPIGDYTQAIYQKECAQQPEYSGESPRDAKVRCAAWMTTRVFMQNLMERATRMGEEAGLQILVPFCDEDLYDYIWNLPHAVKCAGHSEKGILRFAMSNTLPNRLAFRKKSPFPKTHDPVYADMVYAELQKLIDQGSPMLQILNADSLMKAARESNSPWFGQLMGGVQLAEYAIQMHYWFLDYHIELAL